MKERFDVSALQQLSTPQLDAMLHAELNKQQPDDHAVRLILRVLRAREADFPVETNAKTRKAWETYTKKTAAHSFPRPSVSKIAAVVALCMMMLFLLPREAKAGSVFDRLVSWTESFFQLFERSEPPQEYVFRTAHPGLQKLYDTVAAQGVTIPVVPMWLDEAFELEYCETITTPTTTKVLAAFSTSKKSAIYELNIYADNVPREFHKDKPDAKKYEHNSISYYLLQNDGLWTVVWENDNTECSIVIDCQEDALYRILDSIYTMENN